MFSDNFKSALVEMHLSEFTFHLTGSRYFGGSVEGLSDYDFFTNDTPEVAEFLVKIGFRKRTSGYRDANVVYTNFSESIDVQLVPDVEAKLKAQEMLKPFLAKLPKNVHKTMWAAALVEVTNKK